MRYVAQAYHQHYGGSVVFFSDLEAFLEEEGTSWRERRTDPRAALDQLLHGHLTVPVLLLLVSRYAHRILARDPRTPAPGTGTGDGDGDTRPDPAWQREAVRQAIAVQLAVDWPAHIRHLIEEGRVTPPAVAASGGEQGRSEQGSEPESGGAGDPPDPPPPG